VLLQHQAKHRLSLSRSPFLVLYSIVDLGRVGLYFIDHELFFGKFFINLIAFRHQLLNQQLLLARLPGRLSFCTVLLIKASIQ